MMNKGDRLVPEVYSKMYSTAHRIYSHPEHPDTLARHGRPVPVKRCSYPGHRYFHLRVIIPNFSFGMPST